MNFLKNLDLTPVNVAKFIGFILGVGFLIAFTLSLLGGSFRTFTNSVGMPGVMMRGVDGGFGGGGIAMPEIMEYQYDDAVFTKGMPATDASYAGMPMLSMRNIMPPQMGGTTGNTAENFEVTDYNVSVEAQDHETACASVLDLKPLSYVIFENSNQSETSCSFTFKVEHAHVEEVLTILKELDPKNLSENIYTVKRQLDDFTNETAILKGKLASIDTTLTNALKAYDDVTALATKTQDVSTLARIIDSKLQVIERLTQERLNTSTQLDRLARAKEEQLDRIDYSYFNVNIYENKYLDGESIGESWKEALRAFVWNVNRSLQNATLNLVAFFLSLIPYLLALAILAAGAKYAWKAAKRLWKE